MSNHIFDELIADYVGVVSVRGHFDVNWFLYFMGLEKHPEYRFGGRFQNYIRSMSTESSKVLQKVLVSAAHHISIFDRSIRTPASHDLVCRIKALCETNLLFIASVEGVGMLEERYKSSAVPV